MSAERSHDGNDPYDFSGATSVPTAPEGEAAPKKTVGTKLVELAEADYEVFLGEDGNPYAVSIGGPNIALPLRGRDGLRQRLARRMFSAEGFAPSSAALADSLAVLEGKAAEQPRMAVALRLASHEGRIVIDLGDPDGRCVIVKPGGWAVADRSPVLFRRTALTGMLPEPVPGRDVALLEQLVNADQATVRLLVGWLVHALIPDVPHPILAVFGEQGTAKTTLMRLLAQLIDPSPAPTRTAPRDLGQWAVTASGSWLVGLDNISTIPEWLSDAMCRAVTGDALTGRALYTDSDISVLSFRRVLAMTSIDAGSLRGDLGERLLPIELDRIDPRHRREDAAVTTAFTDAAPLILGALLDLLAAVLDRLPTVRPESLPRMADFARTLHALDAVTGWTTVTDYAGTAADIAETVIDSDAFAVAVRDLAIAHGTWTGTAAELRAAVTPEKPPRDWPRSPRAVAGAVRRITPALRSVGVAVEHGRLPGGNRTRTITLLHDLRDGRDAGDGRDGDPDLASVHIGPGEGDRYPWENVSPDEPSRPSRPSREAVDQQKRRDGRGDGSGTVDPFASRPSRQPSRANTASDQREHPPRDGRDGRDGQSREQFRCGLCGLATPADELLDGRCFHCLPAHSHAS